MEAKSDKATAKKFSFRKRRSSKGKKENDVPPVDSGPEQEATELVHEETPESIPSVSVELEHQSKMITPVEDDKATQSCCEDSTLKCDDSPPEGSKKTKSKRRSWFKGSSKKSSEKVEHLKCELEVKENAEEKVGASEGFVEADVKSSAEQVVGEDKHGEITDQSDGEGYLSLGEASEAEGADGKGSPPESADDKGTKRKGFFKRGLSLKRRKSKKQTSEAKDANVQTNESGLQAETTEQNSEINEENKTEAIEEENDDIKEQSKAEEETSSVKKSPAKPPRKVSFLGPDGKKLESSDDGDSLTDHVAETGDESDEETVGAEDGPSEDETVTAEDGPSEDDAVTDLVDPNEDVPEIVVVMSEDAGCSEPLTEGDDDDLTEVSSMSSSLLASDAPDTISTSDASRLFVFTDTDDTGSRITLTGICEESEADSTPEVVDDVSKCESKPEVASEEPGIESKLEISDEKTGFESRPEATETEPEATKLLGDKGKVGEWEMVDRSYDMSVELQRVRKQTLFSVKRLCCTVM